MADYRPVAPQSNTTVAPQAPRGQVNTGNSFPVQRARQEQAAGGSTHNPRGYAGHDYRRCAAYGKQYE